MAYWKKEADDEIEAYLENLANELDPQDHCCECIQGIPHAICIQYKGCNCLKLYI